MIYTSKYIYSNEVSHKNQSCLWKHTHNKNTSHCWSLLDICHWPFHLLQPNGKSIPNCWKFGFILEGGRIGFLKILFNLSPIKIPIWDDCNNSWNIMHLKICFSYYSYKYNAMTICDFDILITLCFHLIANVKW